MKKIYIIALFLLSIVSVKAQFVYGPRFGLDYTTLSGANDGGLGFHFGVFLKAEIFDRIGVQPEVLYAFKTSSTSTKTPDTKHAYRASFVEVPILFFFPMSDHLTVKLGPQIVIGSGGKDNYTLGTTTTITPINPSGGLGFVAELQTNLVSNVNFSLRYAMVSAKSDSAALAHGGIGAGSTIGIGLTYTIDW